MQLTPDTYVCPLHHVDLTATVRQVLEEQPPPVVYGKRAFRVPVTCPGDGASGAHQQVCSGEREP